MIENSTLSHNYSDGAGGGYGACYSGLVIRNSLVEYNEAYSGGGGLYYASGLIQNSVIRYNESSSHGGGLESWAVIENSLIEGNIADDGGGVYHEGSTMFNVTVKDNYASAGHGGGLYVYNYAAQIFDSTFSGNQVRTGHAGAGIYSSDLPIYSRDSTFSNNFGADSGGAIYSFEGVVDLLNSTVSGNSALQGGGLNVTSGTLSLNHSTVVSNMASDSGGGLLNGHTSVIRHSIVAGNSSNGSTSDGVADCEKAAPITFGGYSLFGSGTGCAASGRGDITVNSADVFVSVLGPLADNGGDTETHALPPGSPAIDAGDPFFVPPPEFDQRGFLRSINGRVDIGALEAGIRFYLPLVVRNHGG